MICTENQECLREHGHEEGCCDHNAPHPKDSEGRRYCGGCGDIHEPHAERKKAEEAGA